MEKVFPPPFGKGYGNLQFREFLLIAMFIHGAAPCLPQQKESAKNYHNNYRNDRG
jgi:hypothetical protein